MVGAGFSFTCRAFYSGKASQTGFCIIFEFPLLKENYLFVYQPFPAVTLFLIKESVWPFCLGGEKNAPYIETVENNSTKLLFANILQLTIFFWQQRTHLCWWDFPKLQYVNVIGLI
jgi:hypothetical protein